MSNAKWIDVSVPLRDGLLPWPGDPPFHLERASDQERGDVCTFSSLSMSAHAGTHLDAPLHFVRRGRAIDLWPLDATVGPARVIAIRNPRTIEVDELQAQRIRKGADTHRILLGAGIWIIEWLDLRRIPAGPCDLICLPLRIVGGDGAPARAMLRPRSPGRRKRSIN